ncbi:MAG: hypothetical protein ABH842_05660 [Candidatus Micrarchaeota archaeon]
MKKTVLLFLGVVVLVVLLVLILSLNQKEEGPELLEYYKVLAEQCEAKGSYSCCMASVNNMAAYNYMLEPATGCPSGYQRNMLKCIDTFVWCEKMDVILPINNTNQTVVNNTQNNTSVVS